MPKKGFKHSEESKKKMSESKTGFKHSEETKRKISESLKGEKNSMYGVRKFGEDNPSWKGGRKKTGNGYILLNMPEHPSAINNYIYEHRYSTECMLGRFLESKEVIHHIDSDRKNNLPENLYLFDTQAEHMNYENLKNSPQLVSNLTEISQVQS
ncbi:NUMOD3 domain-containing DNA-binding protein [Patescibacteria group bacterium AH-259-L07]|nr:NUMOD3 domain-containing DNA-binding protein [Patescibacteria group bacterium AH-259-L07]